MLSDPITLDGLFDTVMAGYPNDIVPALKILRNDDRQALLCTICSIHDEIKRNSLEHGRDVHQFLESQCPLFLDGVATCMLDEAVWKP